MSYFRTALWVSLRRTLRQPRSWLALLLPPLLALALLAVPAEERGAPVQVGVALADDSGQAFWDLLAAYGGETVAFHLTDEAALRRNVALSRWDCGLIVSAGYAARTAALDTDGLITVVTGPGSTAYPVVREAAAACVARSTATAIADGYLADQGLSPVTDLPSAGRVDIRLEVLDGGALTAGELTVRLWDRLLLGALTAAAALYVLLALLDLERSWESPSGSMERRLRGGILCALPRLLAALLPMAVGLLAAVALLA